MTTPDPLDFLRRFQRPTPMIHQTEASECGLAALAMVAAHHGYQVDLPTLRHRFGISLKGATLAQLLSIAEQIGLLGRPLRGNVDSLVHLPLPAILHWNLNHFVVLTAIKKTRRGLRYEINDPALGTKRIDVDALSEQWTGVAIELIKSGSFAPRKEVQQLKLTGLWSSITGFWQAARLTLTLSILLQIMALATPFYMQIAIDSAYPAYDFQLLEVLAIGFGCVAIVSFITSWNRALMLATLTNLLSYQVTINIFRHMLRLPLPWFEKRHVGDVVSRFNSTIPIAQLLTGGLVTAIIDGLMALVTLSVMFLYSSWLALISISALAIYMVVRLLFFEVLKVRNIASIRTQAIEQSSLIETIRGISAIKAFGQEGNRQQSWQRKKADATNDTIKLGRMTAGFDATAELVVNLERVLFVFVAVSLAFDGKITVGMIFAFQAYRQQFLDAGVRLIGQAINFRMVRLHLSRIADIALTPIENAGGQPALRRADFRGQISLSNMSFGYARGEPLVLAQVNLTIRTGEMVAFVGPSGGGKTTLTKIMMGLLTPSEGQLLIDGVDLARHDPVSYRRMIGSVAQDDALYAGSIAENIAFFDPDPDLDRVRHCARLAHIDDEIERMPLRYDTLVGDMGSVLSGGQKQRVLLARALYPDPVVLFMDEGTAHLDEASERQVVDALCGLPMTRIIIAHRSQAIGAAQRRFLVLNQRVGELALPSGSLAQDARDAAA